MLFFVFFCCVPGSHLSGFTAMIFDGVASIVFRRCRWDLRIMSLLLLLLLPRNQKQHSVDTFVPWSGGGGGGVQDTLACRTT